MRIPSLSTLYRSVKGECLKNLYKAGLLKPAKHVSDPGRDRKIIISLTSYGRRASATLPITLCSLTRQQLQADEIVVWLGDKDFSEDTLPPELLRYKDGYGVSFRFCKDIGCFTKIIPSLMAYPDALIITVDDDIYYPPILSETLVRAYEENPDKVNCLIAHEIKYDENGKLLPYNSWNLASQANTPGRMFATGVGGVIYSKDLFHNDVTDESLFLKLSPKADDIWLYVMEKLKGTDIRKIENAPFSYPLDAFYQRSHKSASLQASNRGEDANDTQLRNVLTHYGLKDRDLADI